MQLKIEILEFLQENPDLLAKFKEAIDITREMWEMMAERNEVKEDLEAAKYLYKQYELKLEDIRKEILKRSKSQFQSSYF